MAVEKLKRCKSRGHDQIAELNTAGGGKIGSEIHKLINYI
jgi:hypothetical protein